MIDALGISFLITVGAAVAFAVILLTVYVVTCLIDTWPEFEMVVKGVVIFLCVWGVLFVFVCAVRAAKHVHAKAEAESVTAQAD